MSVPQPVELLVLSRGGVEPRLLLVFHPTVVARAWSVSAENAAAFLAPMATDEIRVMARAAAQVALWRHDAPLESLATWLLGLVQIDG